MERREMEPTLIDGLTADLGGPRTTALLDQLDRSIPWEQLAKPVRQLYKRHDTGARDRGGAPPWPAITMLKCLLLAKWYGLSDPQLEENLRDRLSFRRFVRLPLHDKTPDETTFVRFRDRLRAAGLDKTLFEMVAKHIEAEGVLVKDGTLVDATIIEQAKGRKKKDGTSTRDPDASFTKKHGRTHHGYKGHIAADKSGIVTDYRFSTASHHDSRYFDELVKQEKKAAYGDSAYASEERRRRLRGRGVIDAICYKRHRGQEKLFDFQERWNTIVSRARALVEHPFARIKGMGLRRVRYRGRRRNEFDFALTIIAHNLKRALFLAA